jgi:hypothetical protein
MANKWMTQLLKLEGAISLGRDVYANPLRTASYSANFIYGKTHGLPFGYTSVLYGPPKGGKSVLLHMMIGWLHQTDPDAIAVKIDTEFRSEAQLDNDMLALYGIDPDRLLIIQTNTPKGAFDQVEKDMAAMMHKGAPIRLIAIDSISGVQGRRELETESVMKQTIGDHAQTVQIGLKKILPVIRHHKVALVLVAQARGEMDAQEQRRNASKYKMQAGFGLQHMAEYFVVVEENVYKTGRQDLLKNEFVNPDATDVKGKGQKTAMKITVKMKASSLGPKGRAGEFTFHFRKGLINSHEEAYLLGTGYKVITDGEKSGLVYGEHKWRGKEHCLTELKENPALCDEIMAELQRRDLAGEFADADAVAAAADSEDESDE